MQISDLRLDFLVPGLEPGNADRPSSARTCEKKANDAVPVGHHISLRSNADPTRHSDINPLPLCPEALIDLRRRGQYGAETYSRIGRASPTSRLVVYTSYLTPEEETAARAAGACCCMLKGLSIKELATRLVEICAGPAQESAESGLGIRSA